MQVCPSNNNSQLEIDLSWSLWTHLCRCQREREREKTTTSLWSGHNQPNHNRGVDVMFGLFQLLLAEVTSITKTEPRCITQPRKLHSSITEAKIQEALWTRQNLSARCVKRLHQWKYTTAGRKHLQRNYIHTQVMYSSLPKFPIAQKTMDVMWIFLFYSCNSFVT